MHTLAFASCLFAVASARYISPVAYTGTHLAYATPVVQTYATSVVSPVHTYAAPAVVHVATPAVSYSHHSVVYSEHSPAPPTTPAPAANTIYSTASAVSTLVPASHYVAPATTDGSGYGGSSSSEGSAGTGNYYDNHGHY